MSDLWCFQCSRGASRVHHSQHIGKTWKGLVHLDIAGFCLLADLADSYLGGFVGTHISHVVGSSLKREGSTAATIGVEWIFPRSVVISEILLVRATTLWSPWYRYKTIHARPQRSGRDRWVSRWPCGWAVLTCWRINLDIDMDTSGPILE